VHLSAIGHPIVGDALYGAFTGECRATFAPCSGSNAVPARAQARLHTSARRAPSRIHRAAADDLDAVLNDIPGWADRDD
jgi:23S rRNA-/tRNA-specific pseudouridylate synthase